MTRSDAGPVAEVQAAFAAALGVGHIDHEVGFFDLGADSVTIVRAVNTLRRTWPELRAVDAFAHPTVASLAAHIVAISRS